MILILSFCGGILSSAPGCRVVPVPLYDVAATPMSCVLKAQEIQAEKAALYPGTTPGRWSCRGRGRG